MTLTSKEISILQESGLKWGSCYKTVETDTNRSIECSVTLSKNCDGVFLSGKDCQSDSMFNSIKDSDGNWNAIAQPISSFSDIKPGDNKYDSIFVGIYTPNTITVSNGINTSSSSDSNSYAIFLYPKPFYANKPVEVNEKSDGLKTLSDDTSFFNGRYNSFAGPKFGPPVNVDTNFMFGVESFFRDWYYPSIGELIFIHNQYMSNPKLRAPINSIFEKTKVVRSSTAFSLNTRAYPELDNINKKSFYSFDFEKRKIVYVNFYIHTLQFLIRSIPIN